MCGGLATGSPSGTLQYVWEVEPTTQHIRLLGLWGVVAPALCGAGVLEASRGAMALYPMPIAHKEEWGARHHFGCSANEVLGEW